MERREPGSSEPRAALRVSYSHLFRGVRLRAPRSELALPFRASIVDVVFSDGVELEAELVEQGGTVSALALPAYDTATGHRIAATVWPIDDATTDDDTTTIKLGRRLGP